MRIINGYNFTLSQKIQNGIAADFDIRYSPSVLFQASSVISNVSVGFIYVSTLSFGNEDIILGDRVDVTLLDIVNAPAVAPKHSIYIRAHYSGEPFDGPTVYTFSLSFTGLALIQGLDEMYELTQDEVVKTRRAK